MLTFKAECMYLEIIPNIPHWKALHRIYNNVNITLNVVLKGKQTLDKTYKLHVNKQPIGC